MEEKDKTPQELLSLTDKIVLVIGGASKLLIYVTQALLESGAKVAIASRDLERNREAVRELQAKGYSAVAEEIDVTDTNSIEECKNRIIKRFGRLDVLINGAAMQISDRFEDMTPERWRQALDVTLTGTFLTCQSFVRQMKKQGYGNIINIGSMYGVVAANQNIYEDTNINSSAVYAAAKGGVINFTRFLACYLAKDNIRVNCLSPGGFFSKNIPEAFLRNFRKQNPMGRMGYPNDIKGVIVFLASDAARYMTGHNLVVDGGWTAW